VATSEKGPRAAGLPTVGCSVGDKEERARKVLLEIAFQQLRATLLGGAGETHLKEQKGCWTGRAYPGATVLSLPPLRRQEDSDGAM
jgi:hypothetical protein